MTYQKIYSEVARALTTAPEVPRGVDYYYEGRDTTPEDDFAYARRHYRPDTQLDWFTDEATNKPGRVLVPTAQNIWNITRAYYDLSPRSYRLNTDHIKDTIIHEQDHATAAMWAGAVACEFGVLFRRDPGTRIPYRDSTIMRPLFSAPPTVIGLASMYARPLEPSYGDKAGLRQLGFASVIEVDEEVQAWNVDHPNQPLLRPRSVVECESLEQWERVA